MKTVVRPRIGLGLRSPELMVLGQCSLAALEHSEETSQDGENSWEVSVDDGIRAGSDVVMASRIFISCCSTASTV